MPVLRLEAKSLTDADVDIVAMVDRGANRLPFKLTKRDGEPMLDIGKNLKGLFAKAEDQPTVLAVVLAKSADQKDHAALLAALGFAADAKPVVSDTAQTFAKADADKVPETEISLIKMHDDVALMVTGVKKGFVGYNCDSTMFKEVLSTGSFYPSVGIATDMFRTVVMNTMDKAESPAAAAKTIEKAATEFASYVTNLTKNLPVAAFKADHSFLKAAVEAKPAVKSETKDETKKEEPKKDEAKKEEPKKDEAKKDDEGKKEEPKVDASADILKGVGDLLKTGLDGIRTHVDTTVKALDDKLTGQVAEVGKLAKSANEAVANIVTGGDDTDKLGTRKSEQQSQGAPPLLDTGTTPLKFPERPQRKRVGS